MHEYFSRRYVAPNITVVAAGHFEFPNLVSLVTQRCGDWNSGPIGRNDVRAAQSPRTFGVLTKDKVNQEHVILISSGPAADAPERHAADTLALAVGDDSGSRLYWTLVDPGYADSADCSFHDYEGTGSLFTSFSGDPERAEPNLALVEGVLKSVLKQAKSKILSRVVRGSERPMGRMQALGMSWTYLGTYRSVEDEIKAFDAVTLKSIRDVLDKYPIDQVTTLALGPLKSVRGKEGIVKSK
jgi:predicted Zn-dependent peptidase